MKIVILVCVESEPVPKMPIGLLISSTQEQGAHWTDLSRGVAPRDDVMVRLVYSVISETLQVETNLLLFLSSRSIQVAGAIQQLAQFLPLR